MYLGSIVETGPTDLIYSAPAHPYTAALISAVPVPEMSSRRRERIVLTGDVPSPMAPPPGCRFHPRCRFATELCRQDRPKLQPLGDGREVACHYPLVAPATAPAEAGPSAALAERRLGSA
jgi:peptide/nickel transport system ATP-binding protein